MELCAKRCFMRSKYCLVVGLPRLRQYSPAKRSDTRLHCGILQNGFVLSYTPRAGERFIDRIRECNLLIQIINS